MENFIYTGIVEHGKGLGRTVGMPTANLYPNVDLKIRCGVYASFVYIEGNKYKAVTNVGMRPSVDDDTRIVIESNIIDFDKDIYGKEIKVEFVKFIRTTKKMKNLDEVRSQVEKDKEFTKRYL